MWNAKQVLSRFVRSLIQGRGQSVSATKVAKSLRGASPLESVRQGFAAAAMFSGVLNLLLLTGSIFMLQVYDRVLPSRSVETLQALLLLVALLYGLHALLDLIRARLFARIGSRIEASCGEAVFRSNLRRGSLGSNPSEATLRDLDQITTFMNSGGPAALFDLPWMPLYLAFLFVLHFWFGITGLVAIVLMAAITWRTEHVARPLQRVLAREHAAAASLGESARAGVEAARPMGMEASLGAVWRRKHRMASNASLALSNATGAFTGMSKYVRMLVQSVVLGLGAFLVIMGEASGGAMIASSILLGRALAPVELAIGQWRGFVSARESLKKLGHSLGMAEEFPATDLPIPVRGIDVDKLSVGVSGEARPRLRDVSISLSAGDVLGVIGPSGAGKSTFVRGLLAAADGLRGTVRFDGSTLDQWSETKRGRIIGYLPQDIDLFPGTIAQNISRFEEDAASDEILAAAKAAGVDRLIRSRPQGFDTVLGERGSGLSAGERQRVALARALFRDPFLVVLDEPNSALDAEGEAALASAIEGVRARGGIAILIAHRPSALRVVNKVLALSQGQKQAFGPRDEILAPRRNVGVRSAPIAREAAS